MGEVHLYSFFSWLLRAGVGVGPGADPLVVQETHGWFSRLLGGSGESRAGQSLVGETQNSRHSTARCTLSSCPTHNLLSPREHVPESRLLPTPVLLFVEQPDSSPSSSSSLLLSSLELSDTKVYEPYIRARLGTAAHLCRVKATSRV